MSDTDTEAFANCATGNKRKDLAERFTQYLKSRNTKDNAYVVNLNGAWGTGKTFFVTEWKKLVEDKGHIAIKIDAWESDYLNDPLAIIIAELLEQIKSNIKNHDARFRNAERNVASAIFNMGKSILPIGSKIVGKHLLGEAATNEILDLIAAATGSVANHSAVKDDLNMGDLGLEVASQHKRHKQFTQDFKKQARELVDFALEDNPNKQVFIFIDELDRCRPTYAIEMLETVKHLFDIPNFIFVLSTDTSQLQHSIKAVYGHDFDSHEYLSRFFEQRLTLPELDYFEFLTAEKIFETEDFKPLPTLPFIKTAEQLRAATALICEQNKHQLSLRRVKQICALLEVVIDSKELRENAYPILTLIGMVFGNALYAGLSDPKTKLEFTQLALHDKTHPVRIPHTVPMFNRNKAAPLTLKDIIESTVTLEFGIKHTGKQEDAFKQLGSGEFYPINQNVKLLFENFPFFRTNLVEMAEKSNIKQVIKDKDKLLNIIDNLNILSDTPEE
ncbi:MAG: KAP family NTPase [Gammaproteobacteria bacterium]|nr:KAP family NTPase [Gammaproteobacteria bacterium]MBU1466436.1 KAP family NTPase [Gammaproteobacteria bacterium]MBU2021404.1 KAP family NTPase [Gammaproteobacteria bacterium]MBU2236530.1 KAP family NTPase [Gammaproteobacteria bacterium]MBU2320316.1 KAP family NTPase [Gammaproteobacteria bacterium]